MSNMKCSVKECGMNMLLASIDNGKEKLYFCPLHALQHVVEGFPEEKLIVYPSDGKPGKCEICGKEALIYKDDDMEVMLCGSHLDKLLRRDLEPEAWKILYSKTPNTFLLHDDFYTEDGEAIQPVKRRRG